MLCFIRKAVCWIGGTDKIKKFTINQNQKEMREKAVFPGSFDPFTRAHFDLVREAVKFFDVVILISANPRKGGGMFTKEERFEMINTLLLSNSDIAGKATVDICEGLVTDYCVGNRIDYIVRGIQYKNATEELELSHVYFEENGIKTVFIPSYTKEDEHISSTRARVYINDDIDRYGFNHWSRMIPHEMHRYIRNWIARKRTGQNG